MEDNKVFDEETRARLDLVKIDASHCWKCGKLFDNTTEGFKKGMNKTKHDEIPRFLKPKRNVQIPVCQKCHSEINLYSVQSVPKKPRNPNLNVVIEKVKSIKANIERTNIATAKILNDLNKVKEVQNAINRERTESETTDDIKTENIRL